jgi:hypothetical protein
LRLSPEANEHWHAFHEELEPRLAPGGELEAVEAWAGKLRGAVTRIAGLFHLIEEGQEGEVSANTFARATELGRAYVAHALAFYSAGREEDALALMRFAVRRGEQGFTYRDVRKNNRARFPRERAFLSVAGPLVEAGLLRAEERTDGGGRPATRFSYVPAPAQSPETPKTPAGGAGSGGFGGLCRDSTRESGSSPPFGAASPEAGALPEDEPRSEAEGAEAPAVGCEPPSPAPEDDPLEVDDLVSAFEDGEPESEAERLWRVAKAAEEESRASRTTDPWADYEPAEGVEP